MDSLTIILIAVAVAIAGMIVGFVFFHQRTMMRGFAQSFSEAKEMIGTVLDEDLRRLEAELGHLEGPRIARARQLHGAAAAHAARAGVADGTTFWGEVSGCTEALAKAGRELAAARAVAAGQPEPPMSPPCLFDPAHGPSSTEVQWVPPGGRARPVPACAADAERLAAGAQPQVRIVPHYDGRMPYHGAHGLYVSWLLGYYTGFDPYLTARLLAGTAVGGHLPGHIRAAQGGRAAPEIEAEFGHHWRD